MTGVLVAIGSVKGSPYVTSLAVALAARWPTPGALVVEADPAGGDLAFRFGARREPGLSELAADTRTGRRGGDLAAYARPIRLGVSVVFAPADQQQGPQAGGVGQAAQATRMVAHNCLDLLRASAARRAVIVDVGRLGWDSPAWPLVAAADVFLVAMRSGVEAVDAVQVRRDRVRSVPGLRSVPRLVVAGSPLCTEREITEVTGLPVIGTVPDDRRAADVLGGRAEPGRGWTRLPFLRAARALAARLHAEVPVQVWQQALPPPPGPVPAVPSFVGPAGRPWQAPVYRP
ncbi:hypothetical protein [Virgisporangium aurantiacum]|uniref:MinD-like ATPase involved in chromosome partitioning or flagellar assembly n=1 Tax=Virgisporangium aurantiacum TaxID=175570 RepID=A0A8J3ZJ59_9ACTN|nr:hypothetical protein [Virgisporangium aurantiacum]GIJ62408.1 hypothetical protein Vau01_099240 [Virgisporangium aurantiacum]